MVDQDRGYPTERRASPSGRDLTVDYLYWLLGISLAFALLERVRPARPGQPVWRPQALNDLFYLLLHGYLWALLFGSAIGGVAAATRSVLGSAGLLPELGLLTGASFAVQFAVYLVVSDFLQWCVHRLLHAVPWLWAFHKVHHSIHDMDWAGNFRFHWMEVVVYRSLLYLPLLALGGGGAPLFAVAVFSTVWGHFNHSNLAVSLGPLGRVFNSPRMHLWHHDASAEGGTSKNFGIVLSLWDFLFGTAYWPRERSPERIGYTGDEEMPRGLLGQLSFPLVRRSGDGSQ